MRCPDVQLERREMFSKRNAFIGWLVLTFGKPMAKRKARRAVSGKRGSALAAAVAGVGAGVAGCSTARFLAEAGARVTLIDPGGVGAGASGRNGGFLFPQPAPWINDLLGESLEIYRALEAEGPVTFDLRPWPMLLLAVEEAELPHAQFYAKAVGGEEVDLRADPWFADDLAGGFVIEGGYTLDSMGATTAMAEAARRAGVELRLGCEAKRVLAPD